MARSSLGNSEVVKLLKPFLVTTTHITGQGPGGTPPFLGLDPDAKELFAKSPLLKDRNRHNVFAFVLNPQGEVVHEFHGLPGKATAESARSDYAVELTKALGKLKLPDVNPPKDEGQLKGLPDFQETASGMPGGVRVFVKSDWNPTIVVEPVAMKAEDWKALSYVSESKEIDAAILKRWLVWLYPAGIRAADESKRFEKFTGKLRLEPAGADKDSRYALLRGDIRLAKGNDKDSAFEGTLQLVVTYRLDGQEVQSVRGIIEGDFVYRIQGGQRLALKAAIESRPK